MRFRRGRRSFVLSVLLLPVLVALVSCYSAAVADRAAVEQPEARKHRLRLTYPAGHVIIMPEWTVEYPFVIGEIDETSGNVPSDPVERSANLRRFNLDEATKVETYKTSPLKIAGVSGLSIVGAMVAFALILAATSCPTVYVVDGAHERVVGEAYPGAIFRSVQREDLLPLPPLGSSTVTLRLRNDNPEVQYTDYAALIVVKHTTHQSALATHDGRVLLSEGSNPPVRVLDLEGSDVTAVTRSADSLVWQSDMDAAFRSGRRELREGIVATFENPKSAPAALVIAAENTLWMSAVFHRGFAMMGSSFGPMMRIANQADRAGIGTWRAREGVDLRVEVWRDGQWAQTAIVQTPGVVALRTMAVPLGTVAAGELRVRLSGGFGFWRIGSVALTEVVDVAPVTTTIPAASTGGWFARADGDYHVMKSTGDSVDLTFALPPPGDGERSLFLATSGYYNPLAPKPRVPQLAALNEIRSTPGALARSGLDLYARHRGQLHQERAR